ncbi:uncharacterized protein PGTG_10016 [Puccinia graminis f. sp. tritici CRL 75-36-700-3]|uniref:Uncharacterized protein n=1 Tax=Puccinia graminis f. sp. tritici (strain CRL 75-36-700-3 / race SCCL) TaxID=418459 RepID=E3KF16_PUCGT|nr:uncharacterized protein PGTG_10016 [Puccinia graminis f. sp. tritici CRL 75-36-700-3]EFP83048.2 hypothetical protein PGTG_10016 [Puccinia graminis f. sp. tritici CRL 75-36-700-3]
MKKTVIGPILFVTFLQAIQLQSAPAFLPDLVKLADGAKDASTFAEAAKGGTAGANALRDANELKSSFTAGTSVGAHGAELANPQKSALTLALKPKGSTGSFQQNSLDSKKVTGVGEAEAFNPQKFVESAKPGKAPKEAPGAGGAESSNSQKALESAKPTDAPKEAPKPGAEPFQPKEVEAPKPGEAPKEVEAPKPGEGPVEPAHIIPTSEAPLPPRELPIRPLSDYPFHFRAKEWIRQATVNKMLVHLFKYGEGDIKTWVQTNEFALEAMKWEEEETLVGHYASKIFVDKWRWVFPEPKPGEVTFTSKVSKGWQKIWRNHPNGKRITEGFLKAPFWPMTWMAKRVAAIRSSYCVDFVNWLKLNAPGNIRATIPDFKLAEKADPLVKESSTTTKALRQSNPSSAKVHPVDTEPPSPINPSPTNPTPLNPIPTNPTSVNPAPLDPIHSAGTESSGGFRSFLADQPVRSPLNPGSTAEVFNRGNIHHT